MRLRAMILLLLVAASMAGCEAIGAIFEAGFWTAIILVVVVLAIIGFIVSKLRP